VGGGGGGREKGMKVEGEEKNQRKRRVRTEVGEK